MIELKLLQLIIEYNGLKFTYIYHMYSALSFKRTCRRPDSFIPMPCHTERYTAPQHFSAARRRRRRRGARTDHTEHFAPLRWAVVRSRLPSIRPPSVPASRLKYIVPRSLSPKQKCVSENSIIIIAAQFIPNGYRIKYRATEWNI